MKTHTKVTSIILGCSAIAHSQQLTIPAGLAVSPQNPSVTFFVTAHFDASQYYAFGMHVGTISASDGIFSAFGAAQMDPAFLIATPGTSFSKVLTGQLHFPPGFPTVFVGSPVNIYEVTWTTNNFTPRTIDLTITSDSFRVYTSMATPASVELLLSPTTLSGTIHVIPAPATSLAFLGAAGAVGMRQRR